MTVRELLLKLQAGFGVFTPTTLEAWAAAYWDRLHAYEGQALRQAYIDTLASFQPTSTKAWPMPADFEF